ncbi:MAG: T9SS type A sorting domain-containing protein [Bacteroidia bacterium]
MEFPTPGLPHGMCSVDFNGDGKKDIATANFSSNTVSVLLGNGNGSLGVAANYAAGSIPIAIVSSDFNLDGLADLATANAGSGNVSIILGTGGGNFGAASNFAVGGNPSSLTCADFNQDGKPDLAATNSAANSVSVLLGNGSGGFGAASNIVVGTSPNFVISGDFNMDGKKDLGIANNGSDNLSILLGNGSGSFSSTLINTNGIGPTALCSSDFNLDGFEDLACTNSTSGDISVFIGNGLGGFAAPVLYPCGSSPVSIACADFNNDSKKDLVVEGRILFGSGSGTFTSVSRPYIGASYFMIGADYNLDANNDLVVVSGSYVVIMLGDGSGSFVTDYYTGTNPRFVLSGDYNSDGNPDIISSNQSGNNISLLINRGNGDFDTAGNFAVGTTPYSLCTNDFNGDGFKDVAVAVSNNVSVLLGNGTGSFSPYTNYPAGTNVRAVTSADFNGDGKIDLVVANYGVTGKVSVLMGNGSGGFGAPTNFLAGANPISIVNADFNNDTKLDLAVANYTSSSVSILHGDGSGNFSAPVNIPLQQTGPYPISLVAGDFNGDSNADLAVAINQADLEVLFGDGATGFTINGYLVGALNDHPYSVCTGDFNGDGKTDLATGNNSSSNVAVFLNNGLGLFGTAITFASGYSSYGICSADLDGNGKGDLAVGNNSSSVISILLNSPSVNITGTAISCAGNPNTLIANGATTYTWSSNAGSSTSASVVVAPVSTVTYTVTGTTSGCSDTATKTIFVNPLPVVSANAGISSVCAVTTVILSGSGSASSYAWTGGVLNGVPFTLSANTTYTVNGTDANGCSDTASIYIALPTVPTPEICMVTVDSISANNLIVWDKSLYPLADTFYIYRDTANNNYALIGTVPVDSLSQFADTVRSLYAANGDPTASSWRYKIAIRDTCGVLSPMSPYHQTIFMIFPSGNFSWNHYQIEGQPQPVPGLSSYLFKRDDFATGNYVTIQALSASSLAYIDPQYATYASTADWRVETQWTTACTPTMRLIDPATMLTTVTKSRSNIKNNRIMGIKNKPGSFNLEVYPNPASSFIIVSMDAKVERALLSIENLLGQKVQSQAWDKSNTRQFIDISQLNKGVYFLRMESEKANAVKKIVVE